MTKFGFYSIVQKQPGVFHVRARERNDLRALTRPDGPLPYEKIYQGRSDYPYRVIVGAEEVRRLLKHFAETLDYDNFKAEIGRTRGQELKREPYCRIWHTLASALGCYGHVKDALDKHSGPIVPDLGRPDYWKTNVVWPGPCEVNVVAADEPTD